METANEGHKHEIRIHIDRTPYIVHQDKMTGLELRTLASIPANYDLWQEVTGPHEDKSISDTDVVCLEQDMHFYGCRQTINPGGRRAVA